jgi:N-acetylmuramoyl-L-alanine amidase
MKLLYIFILIIAFTSCRDNKNADQDGNDKKVFITRTRPILVLDAGHGARDPGAVNDSLQLYEKNVTRKIVDEVIARIDTTKIQVIQTRPGDSNIHRHERIKLANKYFPDLLLTVHINHDLDTTYNGFEMSYCDSLVVHMDHDDTISIANPNRETSKKYVKKFVHKIARQFPKMRNRYFNARKDRIWMICAGRYPSLLLEFGFISNRKDLAYLTDKKAIAKLADTITESLYETLLPYNNRQIEISAPLLNID